MKFRFIKLFFLSTTHNHKKKPNFSYFLLKFFLQRQENGKHKIILFFVETLANKIKLHFFPSLAFFGRIHRLVGAQVSDANILVGEVKFCNIFNALRF
jgi:hypothetical protein